MRSIFFDRRICGARCRLNKKNLEKLENEEGPRWGQAKNVYHKKTEISVSEWHILQSLRKGAMSSSELKKKLDKDTGKSLSGAFKEKLIALRKKGLIEYTIPENPKGPKQKY